MSEIFIPAASFQPQKNIDMILADAKRSGASRVFLCLGDVGRFPFEKNELRDEILECFKKNVALFRSEGIEPAIWETTFGFGGATTHYNKKAAEKYTRLKSICGKTLDDALCPMDKNFTDMYCDYIEDIARTGTKMIMLDDEMCMSVRPGIGCACDLHMAEYRRRLGEDITVEELGNKVFSGKPSRYRDVWLDLMGDTMREFCRKVRAAVDRVDPTIRVGFCSGYTSWDLEGADAIELTKILAGNTTPFLRFTGAPYWIANRRFARQTLQSIIECTRMQYAWCKDLGIETFTESDTYPRDRFHTPAVYSELFHLATLASDNIPTLKYMYDYMCAPDFDTGYVETHVRNIPLQDKVLEVFSDKELVGIRVYETMRKLKNADLGNLFPNGVPASHAAEKVLMQRFMFSSAQMLLSSHAIPTVYDGEGLCGIAFGENARHLPKEAFNKGLILDIKAAKILQEKGIDVGLLTDEKIFGGFMELFGGESPDTDLFNTTAIHKISVKENAKVLSNFVSNEFFNDETFPAAYLYENADGQRFMVCAFDGEDQTDSSSLYWSYGRGRQVANALEWLGEPLPARCERNPQLYAICKKNEKSMAIGYFNIHPDEIVNAKVTLAKPTASVNFINCEGKQIDDTTIIINYIKPFGFAGLEIAL